ncbi:MAG: phenylalanine--tRNA ligase subunit beta [Acidobacteriota bacterium]|nr:phenylalanine--tRNA ligase subunit beta [Acidobacteriota bacterium]
MDVSSPEDAALRLTMAGLAVDSVCKVDDDYILDFDLTSNRPDALSHYGIARELAALLGVKARLPQLRPAEQAVAVSKLTSVEITSPRLCPRYCARVILDVEVGPSPEWLVRRLERLGQRSINNIADVTNFVLLEQGHPLHAFDFDCLRGRRIVVRTATEGEQIKTLDGVERRLSAGMLVIADAEVPVAIAGIMGGEHSAISNTTRNVLLESAYFLPSSVRKTARALGMSTEASYRFERGADPEACLRAIDRCAQLIQEIAGGQVAKGVIDVRPEVLLPTQIELRLDRIKALTGLELEPEQVEAVLTRLGFSVEVLFKGARWLVLPPSYRTDIHIEEDLIEEIARHVGYDRIPSVLPLTDGAGSYLEHEESRRKCRNALVANGYFETISFSWVKPELDMRFRPEGWQPISISNPIDEERPIMRTSLLTGLLEAVSRNFSYGVRNVKLFEFGRVYRQSVGRPDEFERLALAATGEAWPNDWSRHEEIDFYIFKGTVETLLESIGYSDYKFSSLATGFLHPTRAASIVVAGQAVGVFGQLATQLCEVFKFKQPVFVCELNLDRLFSLTVGRIVYRPLAKLQAVSRDFSFLVSRSAVYAEIESAVMSLGIPELVAVSLVDVYKGGGIPEDQISLCLSVKFQPQAESLTDEQLAEYDRSIIELLQMRFGARLRDK